MSIAALAAELGAVAAPATIREIMDEVFDGAKVGRADGGAVLAAPADKQP